MRTANSQSDCKAPISQQMHSNFSPLLPQLNSQREDPTLSLILKDWKLIPTRSPRRVWPVGTNFAYALHFCAGGVEGNPLLLGSREVLVTSKSRCYVWPLWKISTLTSAIQKCMPVRRNLPGKNEAGVFPSQPPRRSHSQGIAPKAGGSTVTQRHSRPNLFKGPRARHVGGAREPHSRRARPTPGQSRPEIGASDRPGATRRPRISEASILALGQSPLLCSTGDPVCQS
ncbi:hypothetical protein HispidOSU_021655 [Sigmodon hispidus]